MLTAKNQICGKVLVAMKRMNGLILPCMLDLSSGFISKASFCSSLNTQNLCNTMFQAGCRKHYNFFLFCMHLFTATFMKYCTKCKRFI